MGYFKDLEKIGQVYNPTDNDLTKISTYAGFATLHPSFTIKMHIIQTDSEITLVSGQPMYMHTLNIDKDAINYPHYNDIQKGAKIIWDNDLFTVVDKKDLRVVKQIKYILKRGG